MICSNGGTKTGAPDAVNVLWSWTAGSASAKGIVQRKNTTNGKKVRNVKDAVEEAKTAEE